jgi:hypothetical protein
MCLGRAVRHLCGMSNYRRAWVQGGTYFFTVNLQERRRRLLVGRVDLLQDVVRTTQKAGVEARTGCFAGVRPIGRPPRHNHP